MKQKEEEGEGKTTLCVIITMMNKEQDDGE